MLGTGFAVGLNSLTEGLKTKSLAFGFNFDEADVVDDDVDEEETEVTTDVVVVEVVAATELTIVDTFPVVVDDEVFIGDTEGFVTIVVAAVEGRGAEAASIAVDF